MCQKIQILVFTFTLFLFNTTLKSQNQDEEELKYPETVLIKLIETQAGAPPRFESKMLIAKQTGGIETKVLERSHFGDGNETTLNNNLIKVRTELNRWRNEGYKVSGITSASPQDFLMITIYVLTKN